MNERFLELATIAKIQMCSHERLQEFAELIVEECCVALHPMLRDMISRTQAVDLIVNHFRGDERKQFCPCLVVSYSLCQSWVHWTLATL